MVEAIQDDNEWFNFYDRDELERYLSEDGIDSGEEGFMRGYLDEEN